MLGSQSRHIHQMAYISRLIPLLLVLSVADCWRPMIRRDPLRDPTYEFSPPVTLHYWNEEPPSANLVPPPPGPPLPWLSSLQSSDYTQAWYSYSTEAASTVSTTHRTTTSTTTKPTTTITTTTSSTAPPPAMVIQGHSKVKKYGPVEGSVNSVFVHSGKNA